MDVRDFQIEKPKSDYGDYAVNAAFILARRSQKSPSEIAGDIVEKLNTDKGKHEEFEKIEAAGGYVNFFLSEKYLQNEFIEIAQKTNYGENGNLKGQSVMVEYTDANPFKLFHIGHLMSNAIGEAISRLYEANGAKVVRANYQGDVGLHVAKAIWGMLKNAPPSNNASYNEKVNYLGKSYAAGAEEFEKNETAKKEINEINNKIYDRSDNEINKLYDLGRKWSLEYFETIYQKLDTEFDEYFFESQAGPDGLKIVKENPNIFTESDGAMIFRGEDHGLHNRVFVNSRGLPTYEAKELGLNKKKFNSYPKLGLSIIVTGNEINDYFKVLLKAMELVIPDVAHKTRHIGHGMLRLPTGKMSSRTGDVITADLLIEKITETLKQKEDPESKLDDQSRQTIAIGAIKYSILKQSPGRDVVFDFDKSLSVEGDSGPYLQYTYARLNNILTKNEEKTKFEEKFADELKEKPELDIIRHLIDFPEVIKDSAQNIAPQHLALYVFRLANLANSFYEKIRVLNDTEPKRKSARLKLVETTAKILKTGLNILGIKVLAKI